MVHKSSFMLNSTSRWSRCNFVGGGGKSLGRNILHLEREFCKLWQCCHSCACELAGCYKRLGNARKGAQSLHYKGIKIINSIRPNIKPKGIPRLASPEKQTLFPNQEVFFWGGEGDEYVFLIYYTFSYTKIYKQFCYHLAFLRILPI